MLREDRILFLPKLLYSAVLYNCVTAELFVHVHRNVEDKQHFVRISIHAQFNLWTASYRTWLHCEIRTELRKLQLLRVEFYRILLVWLKMLCQVGRCLISFLLWIIISKGSDVHGKEPSEFPTAWQLENSSRKEVANITLTWGKHAGNFRLTLPSRSDL